MGDVSVSHRFIEPIVFAVAFFVLAIVIGPTHAFAQQTSAQTQQLLPPGANTCQMITVTDVEPHIYGGVLESFDVTISDTSDGYVGVLATVGSSPIPLDYITRWAGQPGLRIHVDTPDIPVGAGVPVTMVLLSSLPNQPTCITSISFEAIEEGVVGPATAPYVTPQTLSNSSLSAQSTPVARSTPAHTVAQSDAASNQPVSSTARAVSSTSMVGASVAAASNEKLLANICTGNNAYILWFILLLIYIVLVAVVVFAEPWFIEDSVLGSTATILVPLILLLAFWYFSASCRAAPWIPVVACVIAIVGLFLAFREYETPPLLPASTN